MGLQERESMLNEDHYKVANLCLARSVIRQCRSHILDVVCMKANGTPLNRKAMVERCENDLNHQLDAVFGTYRPSLRVFSKVCDCTNLEAAILWFRNMTYHYWKNQPTTKDIDRREKATQRAARTLLAELRAIENKDWSTLRTRYYREYHKGFEGALKSIVKTSLKRDGAYLEHLRWSFTFNLLQTSWSRNSLLSDDFIDFTHWALHQAGDNCARGTVKKFLEKMKKNPL